MHLQTVSMGTYNWKFENSFLTVLKVKKDRIKRYSEAIPCRQEAWLAEFSFLLLAAQSIYWLFHWKQQPLVHFFSENDLTKRLTKCLLQCLLFWETLSLIVVAAAVVMHKQTGTKVLAASVSLWIIVTIELFRVIMSTVADQACHRNHLRSNLAGKGIINSLAILLYLHTHHHLPLWFQRVFHFLQHSISTLAFFALLKAQKHFLALPNSIQHRVVSRYLPYPSDSMLAISSCRWCLQQRPVSIGFRRQPLPDYSHQSAWPKHPSHEWVCSHTTTILPFALLCCHPLLCVGKGIFSCNRQDSQVDIVHMSTNALFHRLKWRPHYHQLASVSSYQCRFFVYWES